MESLDEVSRWGLNHDPPQQYGLMDPHFPKSTNAFDVKRLRVVAPLPGRTRMLPLGRPMLRTTSQKEEYSESILIC